jgi:hypothetical protein
MGIRFTTFLVLASAVFVSDVYAQQAARGSVSGAALYTTQSAGTIAGGSDPGVPKPAISGSAPGFSIEGDVAITQVLGIGVEVSNAARFDAMQTTSGSFASKREDRHRDLLISALVHFHPRPHSRADLDVVGGISFVEDDTVVQTAIAPPFSSVFGQYGPESNAARNTFGGVAGLSVPIRIAPHVSVGPIARVYVVSRTPDALLLGLSSTMVRAGATVRISF